MLHQPGKELTVMQGQFLLQRFLLSGSFDSHGNGTMFSSSIAVILYSLGTPFGIPPDILYHLFGHFQRRLQMNNPLLLVYHVFDKNS